MQRADDDRDDDSQSEGDSDENNQNAMNVCILVLIWGVRADIRVAITWLKFTTGSGSLLTLIVMPF